ncbi:NAD(P)-binding protein [Periconia macrospinosa]|uniref:NAD(P)-binding protein n=1 Tax=Periconia macrospinosa TaxID=97972 RepID=A0A2V1D778_9PLEO|nr:NAD(P)-binding protein [Periconia macrospinosa]
MSEAIPSTRRAFRRTDDFTQGSAKVKLVTENLPASLPPTSVLIKVHTISLNYRDANIANGGNPWPVIPYGIPCNDAAGEVVAAGSRTINLKVGDRVAPIVDTENLTGRENARSWLAADEDGVLADYLVFDERKVSRLPSYLSWEEACLIPCAGVTAWSALKGVGFGQSVLIQGTGGVSMFALKLARASGLRAIVTSSSDKKMKALQDRYSNPPLSTVNYATYPEWHRKVLEITNGVGVDLVIEVGGSQTLIESLKSTRRGGVISQVGYLGKQNAKDLDELVPLLIDRRVNLSVSRGINAGSKQDLDDLCDAMSAVEMHLDDIIDFRFPFDDADEAIEYVWQGKQVGKVVVEVD